MAETAKTLETHRVEFAQLMEMYEAASAVDRKVLGPKLADMIRFSLTDEWKALLRQESEAFKPPLPEHQ